MKTFLLSLLGVAVIIMPANSKVLTPDQALDRALSISSNKAPMMNSSAYVLNASILGPDGSDGCYVFDSPQGGFIVVSADDSAPALLGYSDGAIYDKDNVPPAMQYWLNTYANEIAYARELGLTPFAKADAPDFDEISPLTTTKWNQNAPYNDMCPIYNGSRSVTGCVATALAQIMKYHEWPAKGKGKNSYTYNGQTISADFGDTEYDWENMLNVYTSDATKTQQKAVATLMYSCGVSVNMEYTSDESSAASISVPSAMVNYFDYDKAVCYMARDYYGLAEWQKIVYDQLKNYGPVQYSGQSSDGGHSFVCDGYSSDGYFHINWGWGGMSDGYFLLTALDPTTQGIGGSTSGFNYDQDIIANVSKPREGSKVSWQMAFEGNFSISSQGTSIGGEVTVEGPVYNLSIDALTGRMGLKFSDEQGNAIYGNGSTFSKMPSLHGYNKYVATIPQLSNGTYTVTPAFCDEDGEWHDCLVPLSSKRSATATVGGGYVDFTANPAPTISFSDVDTSITPYYVDNAFEIKATITNTGDSEYYGTIVAALLEYGNTVVAYGDNYPLDLMPGESVDMTYVSAFSHLPSDLAQEGMTAADIEPGEYTLCFMDAELEKVLSPSYNITLQAEPEDTEISVTSLALAGGGNIVYDKTKMEVEATVECQSGYFAKTLTLAIFPYSSGNVTSLGEFVSDPIFLTQGNSQNVIFKGDFSQGESGQKYMACVFDGQTQESNPIVFTIEASGIDDIANDEAIKEYYTIDGRKVGGIPAQRGLYIMKQGEKASTVLIK